MNLQHCVGSVTESLKIMEITDGFHCFTINGYSRTNGMKIGSFISSEIFTVGDHQFAIYVYPSGKYEEDEARYVSAYIVAFPKDGEEVLAYFELQIPDQDPNALVDQSTTPRTQLYTPNCPHIFWLAPKTLKHGEMWGASHFCHRDLLEASIYFNKDTLSINCKVNLVVSRTVPSQELPVVPDSDLGDDLGTLLDSIEGDPTFGDVTFEVDGEVFQAHKLVLAARSPVFKSQFYGPMSSGSNGKIHVKDMAAPVFKAMLHFIYKDMFPDSSEFEATGSSSSPCTLLAQHLFVAADRYGLLRLKTLCESKLCANMSTDTVATTLTLAELHHSSRLKAHCLKYAITAIVAVMKSQGFDYLKKTCPSLELELLRATVLERLR